MLLEKDEGQPRFVKKKVFVTSIFLYVEQREQSVPLIIFCSNTCVAGIAGRLDQSYCYQWNSICFSTAVIL